MTTISIGLEKAEFDPAAYLYFDALHQKLAPFLGQSEDAIPILTASFRASNVIVARHEGAILGLAGYQCNKEGFIDLNLPALFRRYPLSGVIRLAGLCLLDRHCPADALLLDGICVAPEARGKGIGTA
ncbi:MAG: GNAT family N-acetyltransferase, partial [Planctomycetota bacterium]